MCIFTSNYQPAFHASFKISRYFVDDNIWLAAKNLKDQNLE